MALPATDIPHDFLAHIVILVQSFSKSTEDNFNMSSRPNTSTKMSNASIRQE